MTYRNLIVPVGIIPDQGASSLCSFVRAMPLKQSAVLAHSYRRPGRKIASIGWSAS
jgi:hypothetical protein